MSKRGAASCVVAFLLVYASAVFTPVIHTVYDTESDRIRQPPERMWMGSWSLAHWAGMRQDHGEHWHLVRVDHLRVLPQSLIAILLGGGLLTFVVRRERRRKAAA